MQVRRRGDMAIVGAPPEPLLRCIEMIASALHPAFDRHPWTTEGRSKRSCVQSSLVVRDYLRNQGLSAEVLPVAFLVRALRNGSQTLLHKSGIDSMRRSRGPTWEGHLVVTCSGFMIDCTVFQFQHSECASLPGMISCPIAADLKPVLGIPPIARAAGTDGPGHIYQAVWLPTPENTGWAAGDAASLAVRCAVLKTLDGHAGFKASPKIA